MKNNVEDQNVSRIESRFISSFAIAGFTYYDGVEVFKELELGTALSLVTEPDNPYDTKAIAIYYKASKLGFVPKGENRIISKLMHFGHQDLFELRVNRISKDEHPENQVGVVMKVKPHPKLSKT